MDWFDQQTPYMQDPGALPGGGAYAQPRTRTPVNMPDLTATPGRTTQGGRPEQPRSGGTGAGGGTGGYQPYSDAALQDILHRYPPTNDGVEQAHAEAERTFGPGVVQLLDHPERLDKFVLPDGRTIDAVIGAGGANPSWGWMVEGAGGHSAGAAGQAIGAARGMGAVGTVGSLIGDPMAGRKITDDPSYGFRFEEGMKALERSAASKGTLLTGGMMKRLVGYGQDLASTEYQNSYARRSGEQRDAYNRLFGIADLGLGATNSAASMGTSYAQNQGNLLTQQGNAQAAGTVGRANAWNEALGTVANIGQQYYQGRRTGQARSAPYSGAELEGNLAAGIY